VRAALDITEVGGAVRIAVRVSPRASQSTIEGVHGGALKVRIAAPPVDGAANDELVRTLAKVLRVPRSSIRIVSGERARSKVVEIAGMTAQIFRGRVEPE